MRGEWGWRDRSISIVLLADLCVGGGERRGAVYKDRFLGGVGELRVC